MDWQGADLDEARHRSFGKSVRIDIAAIGPESDEFIGVLESEMPSARCAHGHTSQYDSVPIDGVSTADGFDGLEHIGFSGPTVAILHTAERVEFDIIHVGRWPAFGVLGIKPGEKAKFAQSRGARAAVQDDIQPDGFAARAGFGDDQAVRLDGTIDHRDICVGSGTGKGLAPRCCCGVRAKTEFPELHGSQNQRSIRRGKVGFETETPDDAFVIKSVVSKGVLGHCSVEPSFFQFNPHLG